MNPRPFIVGLGGTTREGSTAERALQAALARAEELGCETALFAANGLPGELYDPNRPERSERANSMLTALRRADGVIIVDLPPEEDDELCIPALKAGLHFIRLATPTSDDRRLPRILEGASGFLYYVSILGITGTRSVDDKAVREAMARIRRHTSMPVAVGFGIKTPGSAAAIARDADAAVVGSADGFVVIGVAPLDACVERSLGAAALRGKGRTDGPQAPSDPGRPACRIPRSIKPGNGAGRRGPCGAAT